MKVKNLRQTLLKKLGGAPYEFVVKVDGDEIEIIESKNQGKNRKGTLGRVIIHGIPALDFIWRINVETEKEKGVPGLSTGDKSVDVAVVLMERNRLQVYLIELKSKINDQQLTDIVGKLEASISRFYFLLLLNDHKQFPNSEVSFKGVVFYNGEEDCSDEDDQIYKIFKDKEKRQTGWLECATILGQESIPIQFYAKGFKDGEIRVSFDEIK